jgi:O-antigen/teichoic acid export membrane protein
MSLTKNIIINAVGRLSSVVLAVIITPMYISLIGIEAYGLIVFYLTLQVSSGILEMGLGTACNRELAYHSTRGDAGHQAMRNTLRTLECVYWLIAVLLGLLLTIIAPWIATSWLNSSTFSVQSVSEILVLAGWAIALRWPAGIYLSAMLGLQRHMPQSVLQIFMAALSWAGGAAVLWLYGPDVRAFFVWQVLASFCTVLACMLLGWRVMPGPSTPARFSVSTLKGLAPFAASVGGIAILGTVLNQIDKLILSAILPLDQFGYYALAAMIANTVLVLAEPVSNAVFPRFSQLLSSGRDVTGIYHLATQGVSVLVIPLSLVISVFSREVLLAYTGSMEVVESAAACLTVLVLAKMLNAGMMIPYALQMAYGFVRQTAYINIILTLWMVPAMYLMGSAYGLVGAAMSWLVVGASYVLVGVPLMHRKLLIGQGKQWALQAMLVPLATVSLFVFSVSLIPDIYPVGRLDQFMFLILVSGSAMVVAVLSIPEVRSLAAQFLIHRKST